MQLAKVAEHVSVSATNTVCRELAASPNRRFFFAQTIPWLHQPGKHIACLRAVRIANSLLLGFRCWLPFHTSHPLHAPRAAATHRPESCARWLHSSIAIK